MYHSLHHHAHCLNYWMYDIHSFPGGSLFLSTWTFLAVMSLTLVFCFSWLFRMVTILCGVQIIFIICSAIFVKCLVKHLVVHMRKFVYWNLGTVIYLILCLCALNSTFLMKLPKFIPPMVFSLLFCQSLHPPKFPSIW